MTLAQNDRFIRHSPVVNTSNFLLDFPIFSNSDLDVFVDSTQLDDGDYTIVATYVDGRAENATVILNASVTGVNVDLYGARAPRRESNYGDTSPDIAQKAQLDVEQLTAVQQEQDRDFDRSIKFPVGTVIEDFPAPEVGRVLLGNAGGTGFENGPSAEEISNAQNNSEEAKAARDEVVLLTTSRFRSVQLMTDTSTEFDVDAIVEVDGGFVYKIAASDATDQDITGANNKFYDLQKRTSATFTYYKSTLADGDIVGPIEGLMYKLDATKTGSDSVTFDLGVDGVKLYGIATTKHFGAIGDGVAEDAGAIQRAFNWVGDGPYRSLDFMPNSKHKISTTLTMTEDWTDRQCRIVGKNSQLICHGDIVLWDLGSVGNSTFVDLTLVPNVSGEGTAIKALPGIGQYSGQCKFDHVQIGEFDFGLQWGSSTSGANGSWTTAFIDLDISQCNNGINLKGGGNNALTFLGCRIASNVTGILIDGSCYGVKFIGGAIEFNSNAGVVFAGTDEKFSITFDGVYMENLSHDFKFFNGCTNLRNLTVKNCYISSNDATKPGICSVGTGVEVSNMAFRDNFIFCPNISDYGSVPVGTILDNNFGPFEKSVAGNGAVQIVGPCEYNLPATAAGIISQVNTNLTCTAGDTYRWSLNHRNNDGDYLFSGTVTIAQSGDPKFDVPIALKSAVGGTAAGGTIDFDNSSGLLLFKYTPPGGVTTSGLTELTLTRT